jgi:hypothetical protein
MDAHSIGRIGQHRFFPGPRHVGAGVPAHAPCSGGLEQHRILFQGYRIQLSQRRDVIEDPEATPVRRDCQVIVLDDDVARGRTRQVLLKGVPLVAVIE